MVGAGETAMDIAYRAITVDTRLSQRRASMVDRSEPESESESLRGEIVFLSVVLSSVYFGLFHLFPCHLRPFVSLLLYSVRLFYFPVDQDAADVPKSAVVGMSIRHGFLSVPAKMVLTVPFTSLIFVLNCSYCPYIFYRNRCYCADFCY